MSENVQVAVRVRPFNEREKSMESTSCIRMVKETQQTIITDPETNIEKAFTFDYSYNSFAPPSDPAHASQQTVWEDIGIKVLEHAWNGFNVSLFAYGQTGAGKSFSMVGYGSDKGIIPKASAVIFERIEANPSEITFKVEASMMEIYNERVKDLFNPSSDNLKVRDHPSQGPYAEGLTRSAVSSYSEIDRLMNAGILARTTASTNMNATSSRAHTIFQIIVTQSELNVSTGKVMDKVSRINLIDLAGSERAASTGATGSRLKEGAAINQSLSALGNCISALADLANGKKGLVPYRNSKLTHLLKDSLGGNSKTIMIAALSPASVNYSETLGTLRYADRAKQIKNKAIVNEDPNQILIRQLKEELELLRKSMMENMDARPPSRGVGGVGEGELGAEFNGSRSPRINTARERELAAIREQLEENQRLLQESEKSWNERLKETEELARKREEQLKVLGLVSNASELKEKTMTNPHLLNLNEDQQMSEKLVYFINPSSNRIGRIDADEEQNIVIGGLGIMKEHCIITRQDSKRQATDEDFEEENREHSSLFISACHGAKVFLNAEPLKEGEELKLHHCDRLVLGNSNVFRVVIPTARSEKPTAEELTHESRFDWQCAMKELNSKQIKATMEAEAIAEKEKQEMDARMKKMEEMMQAEQKLAEEKLGRQREEWEQHVRALNEQMKVKELEIKTQMQTEGDNDKKKLAEQLAQQESKLAEELVKAEILFEKKQQELVERQKELEVSLQKQMREAKVLGSQKERERVERMKFDDLLLQSIPLVNEANSIADELQKQTLFTLRLITSGPTLVALTGKCETLEDEELAISNGIGAELKVEVNFQESGTFRSVMWDIEQFHANVYVMREMYQTFIEHNRLPAYVETWKGTYGDDCDPFYDPPKPQLIGKSFVFLRNLVFSCKINETTSIFNHTGGNSGCLKCEITPTILSHEWQACQHRLVETCPEDIETLVLPTLTSFIGSNLRINIFVESLRGIPGKLCKNAYVSFKWSANAQGHEEPEEHKSEPTSSPSVDPQLDFNVVIEQVVTLELVEFLQNSPLELRVYGIVPSSNLNKVASHAVDLKNTKSSADLYVGDGSVQFYNADANGRNTLLNKKKSMRRRKGKAMDDENSDILQQYREQLAVQEKTLAENTLELEHKTQEVITLQQYLEFERTQNTDLRCALESLERTNKLLKAKLEEQILKGTIAVPVPAIPEPIQTTNLPTITTTSSDDPAPIVKSSRERPKTASRRRSRAEMDREGVEGTPVDADPVLKKSFEKKESLAETLSSKEYRAQALSVDLVGGQRSVRVDGSLATATMSGLTTYPAKAGVSEHSECPIVPKRIEKPRKSECIVM
ncbi:Kinesin-related protein 1 [Phytophthora idaei]|nr:Kinesin-related protein 1 [Phytophthora idaei]KAG3163222.1 Kinesin-related protein 1 [Phytophthora idaei]KAG3249193.1 Kinesin-related protein 1 [Phytophthora idaei]